MTVEAVDPRVRSSWRARLHAAGMRATPQRLAVLEAAYRLRHATADALVRAIAEEAAARGVAESAINLSTVYRSLDALESVGLLRHAHIGPGAPVYHVTTESPHIHLRCDGCGRIISVATDTAADFVATLREATGFAADIAHAAIHGRCADCAADS